MIEFQDFIDQLFEQNISQSIRQREISIKPICKLPFTVHRVDEFEELGVIGFHDHHSNEYYFKQTSNLKKTLGTLPSFGCQISTVIYVTSLKCFVFFLKDRFIVTVDSFWNVKAKVKGPEVINSASQTRDGDVFIASVSGVVYKLKTSVLSGSNFEHINKLGIDNWRMFIDKVEVMTGGG